MGTVDTGIIKSKDELFSDNSGTKRLQELVEETLNLSRREAKAIDVSGLRAVFDMLPDTVQSVARERGLSDQLFFTNARLYFRGFTSRYRAVLGLSVRKLPK